MCCPLPVGPAHPDLRDLTTLRILKRCINQELLRLFYSFFSITYSAININALLQHLCLSNSCLNLVLGSDRSHHLNGFVVKFLFRVSLVIVDSNSNLILI